MSALTGFRAPVTVRGHAVRHARGLVGAVPDAVRLSCVDDVIRVELPEGEFRIDLVALADGRTRMAFRAVVRGRGQDDGTWWTSWEVETDAPPGARTVQDVLAEEISGSRRRFATMLVEACAQGS